MTAHAENSKKHTARRLLSRWRQDRRGLAWQITVAGLSLCIMPFVFWPLSTAWDMVAASILSVWTPTGAVAYAVTFAKVIVSYLLAFFLVFVVYWVLVNAKAQPYGGLG
jgi:hypothetical protein